MKIFSFLSNQPDNVLTRTLGEGKHPFAVAATFSFFSNLLYLAMPLYTYQVYGRVLVSQNIPTLVGILTTVGAFVLLGLALLQERTIRPVMRDSSDGQLRSYAFTEAALRNGEVVRAMGMLPTLGGSWAGHRAVAIEKGAEAAE